ncbi:hypothetical protein ACF0H5_020203 [Mactra antiquata]
MAEHGQPQPSHSVNRCFTPYEGRATVWIKHCLSVMASMCLHYNKATANGMLLGLPCTDLSLGDFPGLILDAQTVKKRCTIQIAYTWKTSLREYYSIQNIQDVGLDYSNTV